MSRGASQRNLIAVTSTITAHHARVIRVVAGSKHIRLRFRTAAGNEGWISISRAPLEPHKLKGWTRQLLNRADVTPGGRYGGLGASNRPSSVKSH